MNTTLKRGLGKHLVCAILFIAAASQAVAADPPSSKTIRIVVPAAAGGLADTTARQIALRMSEKLGQPVIVDNKPGADTLLGTRLVKSAPPDGLTLLLNAEHITVLPSIRKEPGLARV